MKEPSVLDYFKARLNPWVKDIPDIFAGEPWPAEDEAAAPEHVEAALPAREESVPFWQRIAATAWKSTAALLFALIAQIQLDSQTPNPKAGIALYVMSAAMLIAAILTEEIQFPSSSAEETNWLSTSVKQRGLVIGIPAMLLAFLTFGGNNFTLINLVLWGVAIYGMLLAFWEPQEHGFQHWKEKIKDWFAHPVVSLRFSVWGVLLLVVIGLVIFFRVGDLEGIPGDPFSDHAEKLLDVSTILQGDFPIFFPRNTGREAIQMYLTALVSIVFGTGLSFMSLKIGTVLIGLFTLPYMYLLGKELGGRWVGLLALLLAGVSYWGNVIARIGLRFPLYPAFTAPTLYYLIRGLRRQNRNDLILAGIFMGLGLHGYSPMRIVPFVVLAAFGIYLIHRVSLGRKVEVMGGLILLAFFAMIIFLPLMRYAIDQPNDFSYRALTRLSNTERALPGSPAVIFLDNLWKSLVMPFWKNGNIWVHSVTGRPALDVVSAAFFFMGVVMLVVRYLRQRDWLDLFFLVSIPILMMPSILSLAFPDENPSLNRSGGAYVVIFLITAMAVYAFLKAAWMKAKAQGWLAKSSLAVLGVLLLGMLLSQNYDLVFEQFKRQFNLNSLNTSEIGATIRDYASSVGSADSAYVVPYPHWVDTRLVGINAGYPEKDYALWPEDFEMTLGQMGNKLFILKPEDTQALEKLRALYPQGVVSRKESKYEGKDYLLFLVAGQAPIVQ